MLICICHYFSLVRCRRALISTFEMFVGRGVLHLFLACYPFVSHLFPVTVILLRVCFFFYPFPGGGMFGRLPFFCFVLRFSFIFCCILFLFYFVLMCFMFSFDFFVLVCFVVVYIWLCLSCISFNGGSCCWGAYRRSILLVD